MQIFKEPQSRLEYFCGSGLQATAIIADGLLGEEIVTQEFYISVTPVRDGEYLVRTERVAMGVPLAEELVSWSVDRWLTQAVQVMHDPLVGLLRGHRSGAAASATGVETCDLVSLGKELYDSLFRGTIRDSWMIAQGVAQNQHEILRLRLGFKDDKLPLLPWEVLHDGARPLATGADVVFSRYRSAFSKLPSPGIWQRAAAAEHPLRILMVLAAPTDQEVLQLHQEATHLQLELQRDTGGGNPSNLELSILDQPGREQLTQALEQGRYDILHYAGHSDLSASGGDLYLVSDKTGLTEVLSGDDLAGLLVNNGVRMVVFNSCQGTFTATASEAGGHSGNLADALLKRGVPAVLAMAERIPDDVALSLSRFFYRNLKQRAPIDLSLNRARQGLVSSYSSNQLYWALPILYLHPEFDGYLQSNEKAKLEPLDEVMFEDFAAEPGFDDAENLINDLEHGDPEDRSIVLDLIEQLKKPKTNLFEDTSNGNTTQNGNGSIENLQPKNGHSPAVQDAADFQRLGQQLYAQRDWSGAIAAYGDAIKLQPDSPGIYTDLGEALERHGSLPEALTAYKMALQYDPNWSQAKNNLMRLVNGSPLALPSGESSGNGSSDRGTLQHVAHHVPDPRDIDRLNANPEITGQRSIYSQSTLKAGTSTPAQQRIPVKTLATLGATAVVLGSIWFLATRPNNNSGSTPTISASPGITDKGSPSNNDAQNLLAIATQNFSKGELLRGQEAVEQLLEQGSLVEAQAALQTVPTTQLESPSISYQRGRLTWEFIRRKNPNHSVDDARRFFLIAAKGQPTNPAYQNILGFVFYAEGDLKRAGEAWSKAATLVTEQDKEAVSNPEKLTAEAGQALVLFKESEKNPNAKAKAIALRDKVVQANPNAFSDSSLSKDWRWNESTIGDWKKLMALK